MEYKTLFTNIISFIKLFTQWLDIAEFSWSVGAT